MPHRIRRISILSAWLVGHFVVSAALAQEPSFAQSTWNLQTGTTADDGGRSVTVDSQGNTYIAGITNGSLTSTNNGSSDAFLTKYDTSGNIVWSKQIGTGGFDESRTVEVDDQDNVYLTGRTFGNLAGANQGSSDIFVAKYQSDGTQAWSTQLGTALNDQPYGLAVDGFGNTFVTGSTTGSIGTANSGQADAFLMKLNPQGEEIWSSQLGTSLDDTANHLQLDADGNAYITGTTRGNLRGNPNGLNDIFVSKFLGQSGTHFFTRQFGTRFDDHASSLTLDGQGNMYVTGYTEGDFGSENTGGKDAFLMKLDSLGLELWTQQFGTGNDDEAFSVIMNDDGELIVVGSSEGEFATESSGQKDVFAIRFQEDGSEILRQQYGSAGEDLALGTALDADGKVVIVGITDGDLHGTNAGGLDIFVSRVHAVPEPSTLSILLIGTLLLFSRKRIHR